MKACLLFFSALLFLSNQLFAQNPLVGTWKLASGTYTDPDGKVLSVDDTQVQFLKIITPTHFIFISKDLKEGGRARSLFGEYRTEGDTYVEIIQTGMTPEVEKYRTNYTYKVDGDRFTMKGSLTLPDGKVIGIDELFTREITNNSYPDNPAIGTWAMVSSKTTHPDGRQTVEDASQKKIKRVVTPTHWMQLTENVNGGVSTFDSSSGGTYTLEGENGYPVTTISTAPINQNTQFMISSKVQGSKITFVGNLTLPDGGKMKFEEVFEKVKPKSAKGATASK